MGSLGWIESLDCPEFCGMSHHQPMSGDEYKRGRVSRRTMMAFPEEGVCPPCPEPGTGGWNGSTATHRSESQGPQ